MEINTLRQVIARAEALDRAGKHIEADTLDHNLRVVESQTAQQGIGQGFGSDLRQMGQDIVAPFQWGLGSLGQLGQGFWNGITGKSNAQMPAPYTPGTPQPQAAQSAMPTQPAVQPAATGNTWYTTNKTDPATFAARVKQWQAANKQTKEQTMTHLLASNVPADVVTQVSTSLA